jgi:hypothetical protein
MKCGFALAMLFTAALTSSALRAQQLAAAQQPAPAPPSAQTPGDGSNRPPGADASDDKLTFDGDTAIWTVAIRPDKTADFERVMTRLREALINSSNPLRRRQAEGWTLVRLSMPLPGGNTGYMHMLQPVVPDVDYSVMRTLYEELPDERQALYELYRGAFAGNIAVAVGDVAIDLGGPTAPASAPTSAPPSVPPAAGVPSPPVASPSDAAPPLPAR